MWVSFCGALDKTANCNNLKKQAEKSAYRILVQGY